MRRKFESADPLRRGTRRPPAPALRSVAARTAARAASATQQRPQTPAADLTQQQPPPAMSGPGFQEFPLKMCTEDDVSDARYHIVKFHGRPGVNPAEQFVPPIRMHRKDPKQLQVVAGESAEGDDAAMSGAENGAAGDAHAGDAAGSSNSGPTAANGGTGGGGSGTGGTAGASSAGPGGADGAGDDAREAPKRRPFGRKRKLRQIHGGEKNDAARKLRYEEHYPWVMEDFDNKNTWVSAYEAAQSNNYAILTYDAATNGFKVVPIEKFYRMTPYARYATLSVEDAEARMERTNSMRDRWLMSTLQPRPQAAPEPAAPRDQKRGLRTVVGSEERQHKYTMDEEMDFDDQEMFDDDEGAPILDGPDDELKDAEERIKREQLKANQLMDAGNDDDIDKLFDDDDDKEGKQGRRLRKALRSLEKNQYYDTDDEENPYASSDENSSSEDELSRQQQQQQPTALELGTTVKREDDDVLLPLISQFRKKHINKDALPLGMTVLQLPPPVLAKFPAGEWYPDAKRAEATPPQQDDPRLLTRDDVRKHIVSGETEIKQLIMALRPKLVQHRDNYDRLKTIVREIARSKDRKLYLR